MKRFLPPCLALVLAAAAGPVPARALSEAEAAAGRALVGRYADSIVSVSLVLSLNITVGDRTMPPREVRNEENATVISAAGLTVTSLSMIDPRANTLAQLRAAAGGRNVQIADTEFKEVKLRLADGTEIPARVVLKDADTDLAFIAPDAATAAGHTFTPVDLQHAAKGEVLGTYFDIIRAQRDLQRQPLVNATTIQGIISHPRPFYLATAEALGTPVFDAQGAILGLCVQHMNGGRAVRPVILPSAQVAEIAKQAAAEAAKPPPEPAPAADDAKADAAPAVVSPPAKPASP